MSKIISLTDAQTGETIVREMNAEELAYMEQMAEEAAQEKAQVDARLQAKAALLERLGITEEEAQLLLG